MLPVTARKAGPYSCNGSVVDFDFAFKVFTSADIRVVKTTSLGVESDLTLTSDYTVVLNSDQDNDPGGTITTVATYATGNKITIVGDTDYGQPTEVTNRGGFYPDVVMKMVDRVAIQVQQLKEEVDRAVKVDVSSTTDPADLLDDITDSVAAAAASEAAAAASESAASLSEIAAAASAVAADASADAAAASAASIDISTPNNHAIVLTTSGATNLTLPTSGTVATTSNKLSAFAATTSAELAGVVSDETGSGALVFGTAPTISAPNITGHPTIEGVTPTGATGTGKMVFDGSPTLVTPNIGAATGTSLALTAGLTLGSRLTAGYRWNSFSPSDVAGTLTNAGSTGTSLDSDAVSLANSSGTLTITFDYAGTYLVTVNFQTGHAAAYGNERASASLGGTATRQISNNPANSGDSVNDYNMSVTSAFYVTATAGQTLTVLPTYELTGSGVAANHTLSPLVTVTYLGG